MRDPRLVEVVAEQLDLVLDDDVERMLRGRLGQNMGLHPLLLTGCERGLIVF